MVKEYEQTKPSGTYQIHEQIDVQDEKGNWLNGEVIETSGPNLKIQFTGYSHKFDTWIIDSSPRILKQWQHGSNHLINNRIDVLDTYNMWKEARVIDLNDTQVKIHYKGYAEKYDEWLHKTSPRIKEIGSKSNAYGIGRLDPSNTYRHSKKEAVAEATKFELLTNREQRFCQLLSLKGMSIVPVDGDGNCLFRSVSHQLYANESFHQVIRETTMRYISLEKEYFSQFIIGGLEKIDEYIEQMSKNGAWGDDIEIQAMSEIYDKAFNVFVYSNTPIRTFHEDNISEGKQVIRLAYHGGCHYNSIIETGKHEAALKSSPGLYENDLLQRAPTEEFKASLFRYRQEFEEIMQLSIEEALRLSLESLDGVNNEEDLEMRQALEMSMKVQESHEMGRSEEDMLRHVMELSQVEDESELLRQALEVSKGEEVPESVLFVMNSGFTLEQAMEAWHLVGDNPDQMIEYIFSCIL